MCLCITFTLIFFVKYAYSLSVSDLDFIFKKNKEKKKIFGSEATLPPSYYHFFKTIPFSSPLSWDVVPPMLGIPDMN